jgi:hypothetical protein
MPPKGVGFPDHLSGTLKRERPSMKNTKRCPKCQSGDIVLVPGRREQGGAGNLITVSRWKGLAAVKPVLHVCGGCGYMENWLVSPNDIARVKARYGGQ